MEWTKYVLACTLGVCMLILFGRRDEGRDKWIFGLAVGTDTVTSTLWETGSPSNCNMVSGCIELLLPAEYRYLVARLL